MSSTRSFPKFTLDHANIKPFVEWLTTPDGQNKSTTEARAIASDISKFLQFAYALRPKWDAVTDPKLVRKYMYLDHIRSTGACGVEGILTKIQRIVMALKYYKFEIVDESNSVSWHRCGRVEARYKEWCTALIPAKKMAKHVRLSAATTDNHFGM